MPLRVRYVGKRTNGQGRNPGIVPVGRMAPYRCPCNGKRTRRRFGPGGVPLRKKEPLVAWQ